MNIHQSLDQILEANDSFAGAFYNRLDREQANVFRHFEGVNLKRQANLLTNALILIVKEYETPNEAVKYYLRVLGTKHLRLEIDEQAFEPWKDTLLGALQDFHGADWNAELAIQWTNAIEIAIAQMLIGYREPHHT